MIETESKICEFYDLLKEVSDWPPDKLDKEIDQWGDKLIRTNKNNHKQLEEIERKIIALVGTKALVRVFTQHKSQRKE